MRGITVAASSGLPLIDLSDLRISAAIVLRECIFEAPVSLVDARLGKVELTGCNFRAGFALTDAEIDGGLFILDCKIGIFQDCAIEANTVQVHRDVTIMGKACQIDSGHLPSRCEHWRGCHRP